MLLFDPSYRVADLGVGGDELKLRLEIELVDDGIIFSTTANYHLTLVATKL